MFKNWLDRLSKRATTTQHPSWAALENFSGLNQDLTSISGRNAERLSAVTACINLIAGSIGSLTGTIHKRDASGHMQPQRAHALAKILRNPTRDMSFQSWLTFMVAEYLLSGNAIAVLENDGELVPIPWHLANLQASAKKLVYNITYPAYFASEQAGKTMQIPAYKVLHWRDMTGSRDTYVGRGVLQRCSDVLQLTQDVNLAIQNYYRTGCMPSGAFSVKGKLDESGRRSFQQAVNESHVGVANAGSYLILDEHMDYKPLAANMKDNMIYENRLLQVEEVARIFNVPLFYLNQSNATTFASAYESRIMFYTQGLMPHIQSFQAAFNVKFLDVDEELILDASPLTRGSLEERFKAHKIAIEAGIYDAQTAAVMEGIPSTGSTKKMKDMKDAS